MFDAKDNLIEGDRIQLRFAGVQNFDDEQHDPLDMELLVASPFGDIRLEWQADGSLTWRLGGTP